jgi:membrane protein implicated in regulation of membrane protease activity
MMRRDFDLLDIRVTVLTYATNTEPVRVRVEGTVWDGLADANLAGDLGEQAELVTPGPRLSRRPPLPRPTRRSAGSFAKAP